MKKIFHLLKNHLQEDFNARKYGAIGFFLTACIALNYYFDFEDSIIDSYAGKSIRILFYFLFYAFPYFTTVLIIDRLSKTQYFKNPLFWVKSLFIIAVLAFDSSFHYHIYLIDHLPVNVSYTLQKIIVNLVNIITIFLPLFLFYHWIEREKNAFYGFTLKTFDHRVYLFLLLCIAPFIAGASFIDNFRNFYPMYKDLNAHVYLEVSPWVPALSYEVVYGFNFITIELVFRGFMVIGMVSILGKNSLLPMVAVYCFYHFGKPMGEAISSIFGGYILGVLALYTRSILGGIIIHVGLAWMMELFAYMQIKFNS